MTARRAATATLVALLMASASAYADDRRTVLAPLATLGSESSSVEIRAAQAAVAAGIGAVDGIELVSAEDMAKAIQAAKRPQLRSCDGDTRCLAELGALLSAEQVVYGEVGGLGEAQIIYLKVVEVASAKQIRNTVLEMGGKATSEQATRAAAVRLLDPDRYRGSLKIATTVKGASIFVDGELIAKTPAAPIELEVGAHALRVTHPEFRDYVRFVDIDFGVPAAIDVELQPYAAVSGDIRKTGGNQPVIQPGPVVHKQVTPWYRRWYVIAGGAAFLAVSSAVVVGLAADGIDFDREKQLP